MPDAAHIRSVCVFCGSGAGSDPAFDAAAQDLGRGLAEAGLGLVYGGGGIGLMGAMARAALEAGGDVTGIIPDFLKKPEVMLQAGGTHIVTRDLHERMQMMAARADAFAVLPGGIGTVAELVDAMTWTQLGRHAKPIVLLDIAGYWAPLLGLMDHIAALGFAHGDLRAMLTVVDSVDAALTRLTAQAG